jgi:outer membrane protein OmpA-like peptidoglycan-associated protein
MRRLHLEDTFPRFVHGTSEGPIVMPSISVSTVIPFTSHNESTPMKKHVAFIALAFLCALPLAGQQKDNANCKDHPLFTRMPDSWIHSCDEREFDAYEFTVAKGKKQTVEGKYYRLSYYPQAAVKTKPSELQIQRNFENAVNSLGGKSIYKEKSKETFTIVKAGKEIWVELTTEFTAKYGLKIIEKGGMEQDIVANADALLDKLKQTGHVAVDGIYFDTGKSDLKPESEKAIGEIAKLLKGSMELKLYVVGHTDNVGGLDANMKLSDSRAEAVLQALVRTHGIVASRLKSFGNGPYAPVATNDTEEGRAKNRRVELVKQ